MTAATFRKQAFFSDGSKMRMLHSALLTLSRDHEWTLEAWAVFPNHYHFVARSPANATGLKAFLRELHSRTARALNRKDAAPGRKIWHDYWETRLTHQRSYLARLNYVHQNAVRHCVVSVASAYPYCSAAWFERTCAPAQVKAIYAFKIDRVIVSDDF